MRELHVITLLALVAVTSFLVPAFADVDIKGEISGFYGQDGQYNIIGIVENSGNSSVFATTVVQLEYDGNLVSATGDTYNILPKGEMPFKILINDTAGHTPNILDTKIGYIGGISYVPQIEVIYDDTLVVHKDGHVTGRIINSGDKAAKHIELVAVAHGEDHTMLDVVYNAAPILYMMPGEIRSFSMYPDPSISKKVWYYSCFGLGDLSAIPLNVKRGGENFPMRYVSGLLLAYPEFNRENTNLTITIVGGWPLHDSINIEFPKYSNDEKFNLTIDGKEVDFIQSADSYDNWHVAFNVQPQTSGMLVIEGFNPDGVYNLIPSYIRDEARVWALGEISDDEFGYSMARLVGKDGQRTYAPDWVRDSAGWWAAGLVSDEEFVAGLKYLESMYILRPN